MSATRRPPAGTYAGGLAGLAEDPALGIVGAAGLHLHEDWLAYATGGATRFGEVGWTRTNIGSAPSVVLNTPTAVTEVGVVRMGTHTQANRGGTLHTNGITQLYTPPVGMLWAVKLDLSGTADVEVWSGFSGSTSGRVRVADSTQFIGVRYLSTVGTWQGVVKNGSTAANESTVDLGAHTPGTYVTLALEVVDTDGAGTPGVQFMTLDGSDRRKLGRTLIGAPLTANIPQTTGALALGVVNTGAGVKYAYQDFWTLGGRVAR